MTPRIPMRGLRAVAARRATRAAARLRLPADERGACRRAGVRSGLRIARNVPRRMRPAPLAMLDFVPAVCH